LAASVPTTRSREKIVIFDEYKSWNWIIASGSYTEEIFSLAHHARNIMVIATVVLTILLLGILIFFLHRIVIVPLNALVTASRQIADGDLTVRLQDDRQDEVGQVLSAMHDMVSRLSAIIGQVRHAADTISSELPTSGFGASFDVPWPNVSTTIPATASSSPSARKPLIGRSMPGKK